MAKQSCMRCYILGKVQGVWYRAATKEQAEKLGITGWARNLPDGGVEVFACGEDKQLDVLFSWLKQGPERAQVDECIRENLSWREYKGFDIF
jgi:acylphosphatase